MCVCVCFTVFSNVFWLFLFCSWKTITDTYMTWRHLQCSRHMTMMCFYIYLGIMCLRRAVVEPHMHCNVQGSSSGVDPYLFSPAFWLSPKKGEEPNTTRRSSVIIFWALQNRWQWWWRFCTGQKLSWQHPTKPSATCFEMSKHCTNATQHYNAKVLP